MYKTVSTGLKKSSRKYHTENLWEFFRENENKITSMLSITNRYMIF